MRIIMCPMDSAMKRKLMRYFNAVLKETAGRTYVKWKTRVFYSLSIFQHRIVEKKL